MKTECGLLNQKGFTLIDILLATTILGLCALAILSVQSSSWSSFRSSKLMMQAGHDIEVRIEEMRKMIAQDTASNWPPSTPADETVDGISLKWALTHPAPDIKDAGGTPLQNVAKVRVAASWNVSRAESLVVETYVSKIF